MAVFLRKAPAKEGCSQASVRLRTPIPGWEVLGGRQAWEITQRACNSARDRLGTSHSGWRCWLKQLLQSQHKANCPSENTCEMGWVEGAGNWWWSVQQRLSQHPRLWGLAKERLLPEPCLFCSCLLCSLRSSRRMRGAMSEVSSRDYPKTKPTCHHESPLAV